MHTPPSSGLRPQIIFVLFEEQMSIQIAWTWDLYPQKFQDNLSKGLQSLRIVSQPLIFFPPPRINTLVAIGTEHGSNFFIGSLCFFFNKFSVGFFYPSCFYKKTLLFNLVAKYFSFGKYSFITLKDIQPMSFRSVLQLIQMI